jgi:prepilin-type N-terminal cleavage/methylation domain-containing protein
MQRKVDQKNGFTLLEVIIVIFLVTLILGMSTVFFAGFLPSARFSATGREMSAVIRHARSLARMNMEKKAVIIDLDSRVYGIEGLITKSFPPEMKITVLDPVSGEMERGKYPIIFHPTGGMEGGTIILSSNKKVMRIETDPISGAVMIK